MTGPDVGEHRNVRATLLLVGLLLVGCGTPATPDSTVSVSPATPFEPSDQPEGTTIISADSQFGSMLFDASGQAIYLFDAERSTQPMCYDDCAEAWPPVLTTGEPRAEGSVRSALLGTTRRRDGTSQVTYGGHPLYFYAHEGKYQVLCHNIEGFGGTWLVVQPDGDPAPA
jgi:predicted lipoprotein with Yx(FWY)xxD motif